MRDGLGALVLACVMVAVSGTVAGANGCDSRTNVRVGEDAAAIARRCGVNIEALKAANPGLRDERPQAGTFVTTPQPSLPTRPPSAGGNSALQPIQPDMRGLWRR